MGERIFGLHEIGIEMVFHNWSGAVISVRTEWGAINGVLTANAIQQMPGQVGGLGGVGHLDIERKSETDFPNFSVTTQQIANSDDFCEIVQH